MAEHEHRQTAGSGVEEMDALNSDGSTGTEQEVTSSEPDFSQAVGAGFVVVREQPTAVAETVYRRSDDTYSPAASNQNFRLMHHPQAAAGSDQGLNMMGSAVSSSEDQQSLPKQQNPSGPDNNADSMELTRDTAKVYIGVDWQGNKPEKFKKDLQMTLQSWMIKTLSTEVGKKCSFFTFKCLGDDEDPKTCVEAEIEPSAALSQIMKIKKSEMTYKGSSNIIKFEFLEKPQYLGEFLKFKEKQNSSKSSEKSSGNDAAAKANDSAVTVPKENNVNGMMEQQISAGPSVEAHPFLMKADGTEGAAMNLIKSELTVPLLPFWYLTQAYSTELENVLRTTGVHMETEVSVRLTHKENSTSASVNEDIQKFSALVSEASKNLDSVEIPPSDLESDIMKYVQRNISTKENRLVMRTSADNCKLFAPVNITSMVKNQLHRPEQSSMNYGASGSSTSYQTSKPIKVSIRDAPAALQISQIHWTIMNTAFQQQISNLQSKYGVLFHSGNFHGSIQVTAQSTGTHQHNLEAQALAALMKLYQNVVTSTVTCELDDHSNREKVLQVFEKIRTKYPYVGSGEHNGSWKFAGLQEHLVPAVYEIEKIIGPVFDHKTKLKLGSPRDFPQPGAQSNQMSYAAEGRDSDFNTKGESSGLNRPSIKAKDLKEKEDEEDNCPICMDSFTDPKKLQCGHKFCKDCLDQSESALGKICSVCKKVYGTLRGTQPDGRMTVRYQGTSLLGFPRCGSIVIDYDIPSGTQTSEHPNPGRYYSGTHRTAYLPDNQEGKQVLQLLRRAFDQRLIFTVGTSRTTGAEDSVIWNDIHHKTSYSGSFGYPDSDYLRRVKEELKAKGIE